MSWAARRRLVILIIVFAVVFTAAFYYLTPILFKAPTCTDGKQNGTETGIDCGGNMCTNMCTAEVKIPNVLWARAFPVTNNVYNAVAYIENKNAGATRAIPYEFRLYDPQGVFVTRVNGVTLVPPQGRYAIVETGIQVGLASIGRTTFEFSKTPVLWERIPDDVMKLQELNNNIAFDASGSVPKLTAVANNPSTTTTLNDTTIAAILYDADNNAVNVSKTIVPTLAPLSKTPIYFTWPRQLSSTVTRFELLPIINVFHTSQ